MDYTTTTAVDHLDSGPQNSVREDETPSWINSHRLLVRDPYFAYQASTWVPGSDWHNRQWWFRPPDATLRDGELSPDGSKVVAVAATDGIASPYNTLLYWSTSGPAWNGERGAALQRGQRVAGRKVRALRGNVVVGGRSGANAVRFTGRIGGRRLAPGRYRLAAATGRSSASATFTVAR